MLPHNEILSGIEASMTDEVMTLFGIVLRVLVLLWISLPLLAFRKGSLEKKNLHISLSFLRTFAKLNKPFPVNQTLISSSHKINFLVRHSDSASLLGDLRRLIHFSKCFRHSDFFHLPYLCWVGQEFLSSHNLIHCMD